MIPSRLAALRFMAMLALAPVALVSAQTLNHQTVEVDGNGAANTIRFSVDADDLVVVVDGVESQFELAQVDELRVFGFGGDDTVVNDTAIPMLVDAGPGDDYVVGGSGDDALYGRTGDDSLFGRDGDDRIFGGTVADLDYVSGGNGDDALRDADVMVGGNGNDLCQNGRVISGGAGDDILNAGIFDIENVELSGGPGNDRLVMTPVRSALDYSNASVSGGPGFDIIEVAGTGFAVEGVNIDGGPDADVINGVPDDAGIALVQDDLFVAGSQEDDTITITIETGQVVARIVNAAETLEKSYPRNEVDSVLLYGSEGDDVLQNTTGTPTTMFGGPGDDVYMTNTLQDECFNAEGGNDIYHLNGGRVVHRVINEPDFDSIMVFGSDRDETVVFQSSWLSTPVSTVSLFDLGAGDDFFDGEGNDDVAVTVRGGSGNDILVGGEANDSERLFGDAGDDLLTGEHGSESIFGGAGNDEMYAEALINVQSDGEIDIFFIRGFFGAGTSFIDGGPGDDALYGSDGQDTLFGGSGDDTLIAYNGDDVLRGHGGQDVLMGGRNDDVMFGGPGNDHLAGGNGEDVLRGEGGNDFLNGGGNDDLIFGGPGNDELIGENGNDRLNGEGGVDTLDGGGGTNVLIQ